MLRRQIPVKQEDARIPQQIRLSPPPLVQHLQVQIYSASHRNSYHIIEWQRSIRSGYLRRCQSQDDDVRDRADDEVEQRVVVDCPRGHGLSIAEARTHFPDCEQDNDEVEGDSGRKGGDAPVGEGPKDTVRAEE